MYVELLVKAPIIFHELFAVVGVSINIWFDFSTFYDGFGYQHPVNHLGHDLQVLGKQTI